MITQKPWGVSTRRFIDDYMQLEQIQVHAGGYSSVHYHERKLNRFFVISGKLRVTFYNEDKQPKYTRVLEPGIGAIAMPGELHQFFAEEDTKGYELYFDPEGRLDAEDIIRFSTNGVYVKIEACQLIEQPAKYCSVCNAGMFGVEEVVLFLNGAMRPVCLRCADKLSETKDNAPNP